MNLSLLILDLQDIIFLPSILPSSVPIFHLFSYSLKQSYLLDLLLPTKSQLDSKIKNCLNLSMIYFNEDILYHQTMKTLMA